MVDLPRSVPRADGRGGSAGRRRGRRGRVRHHEAPIETRLLLDSHGLIWWLIDSPKLSQAARRAIADPGSAVLASPVSGERIANKERLGRLPGKLAGILPQPLSKARIGIQPLTFDHTIAAGRLRTAPRSVGTG